MSKRPGKFAKGAGLGLRRDLLAPLHDRPDAPIDFFEVAPENWINVGGRLGKTFRAYTERYAFICHGLSLSLGGPAALDETLLHKIRRLLDEHGIAQYSEHLSFCSDEGHLYDLMPIPYTEESVAWVAARIRRTQDILGPTHCRGKRVHVCVTRPGNERNRISPTPCYRLPIAICCSMSTTST